MTTKKAGNVLLKIGAIMLVTGFCLLPTTMGFDLSGRFYFVETLIMAGVWICGVVLIIKS